MINFFLVFGLVTIIFFILSGVTFYGDDISRGVKAWNGSRERQRAEKAARQEALKHQAMQRQQMTDSGVDLLAEQHHEIIAKKRDIRKKELIDWELDFALSTGKYEGLAEAQQYVAALPSGQQEGALLDPYAEQLRQIAAIPRELRDEATYAQLLSSSTTGVAVPKAVQFKDDDAPYTFSNNNPYHGSKPQGMKAYHERHGEALLGLEGLNTAQKKMYRELEQGLQGVTAKRRAEILNDYVRETYTMNYK